MQEKEELVPEEKRPTAAELKAQIEEKQRELKANPPSIEIPAKPEPVPQDQAAKPEPQPQDKPKEESAATTAVEPAPSSKDDKVVDAEAFAKKKGWKDFDALIQSYAHLEKKLGERKPEPPSVTQNPPSYYPPQYQNPQPRVSKPSIEEIARQYGLDPNGLEGAIPLIGDLAETIAERKFRQLEERMVSSERERQREREIEDLKRDRHFQNDEVKEEMSQILESNPRMLEVPNGLTFAFNQALANVGRKRLEGPSPTPIQGERPSMPVTPPTTARGTGPANVARPAGFSSPTRIDPANFNGLPLDEKKRVLQSIGALRRSE